MELLLEDPPPPEDCDMTRRGPLLRAFFDSVIETRDAPGVLATATGMVWDNAEGFMLEAVAACRDGFSL